MARPSNMSPTNLGRLEQYFCKVQSAITAAADPAAADAFRALDVTLDPVNETQTRDDNDQGRDIPSVVEFEDGPHTAKISAYVLPATAGTAPDLDPVLNSTLEKTTRASVTMDTGVPTTTVFQTTDTGIYSAGDIIAIPIELGSSEIEANVVDSVSTASGIDTITLENTLSFTPDADTVIPANVQYKPRNQLSSTNYFTLYKFSAIGVQAIAGCIFTNINISVARGEKAKIEFDVTGRHSFGSGELVLDGGIDDSETSISVTEATAGRFYGIDSNHPLHFYMDDEIVKVTGTDDDGSMTIDRAEKGTDAASHDDGTVLYPYAPPVATTDLNGVPIPGIQGFCKLDDLSYSITSMGFSSDEGIVPVEEYGSQEISNFVAAARREPKLEGEMTGKTQAWDIVGLAEGRTEFRTLFIMGNETSKAAGVFCGGCYAENFAFPSAPNDTSHVQFSTKNIIGTGDNAFRIAYL